MEGGNERRPNTKRPNPSGKSSSSAKRQKTGVDSKTTSDKSDKNNTPGSEQVAAVVCRTQTPKDPIPAPAQRNRSAGKATISTSAANQDGEESKGYIKVSELTVGIHTKILRAQVVVRSAIREWKNQNGAGKLFEVVLADDTAEIRVVGFNAMVDKFYTKLKPDTRVKLECFRCEVLPASKNLCQSQFGLSLLHSSKLRDDSLNIINLPPVVYQDIASISALQPDRFVNVCGILSHVGEELTMKSQQGRGTLRKRELTLNDERDLPLNVELWNSHVDSPLVDDNPVMYLRRVRTKVYGGLMSLSYTDVSSVTFNADHPRTAELQQWFEARIEAIIVNNRPPMMALHLNSDQMTARMESPEQKSDRAPLVFWNTAYIVSIDSGENLYRACRTLRCGKRVEPVVGGGWICLKCSRESEDFELRYSLKMIVRDETRDIEVTAFNEAASELVGKSADEMAALVESKPNTWDTLQSRLTETRRKMEFKCQYQRNRDPSRLSVIISKIEAVDSNVQGEESERGAEDRK